MKKLVRLAFRLWAGAKQEWAACRAEEREKAFRAAVGPSAEELEARVQLELKRRQRQEKRAPNGRMTHGQ